MRKCQSCQEPIEGRIDKRFCDLSCKNLYHRWMKSINNSITRRTDQYLHRNRIVLLELERKLNRKKLFVPRHVLIRKGFKFQYYTGSRVNSEGKMYYYIYDFAWMEFSSQDIMVTRKRRRRAKIIW